MSVLYTLSCREADGYWRPLLTHVGQTIYIETVEEGDVISRFLFREGRALETALLDEAGEEAARWSPADEALPDTTERTVLPCTRSRKGEPDGLLV